MKGRSGVAQTGPGGLNSCRQPAARRGRAMTGLLLGAIFLVSGAFLGCFGSPFHSGVAHAEQERGAMPEYLTGEESLASWVVSTRCVFPSIDHSQRSLRLLFSAMS